MDTMQALQVEQNVPEGVPEDTDMVVFFRGSSIFKCKVSDLVSAATPGPAREVKAEEEPEREHHRHQGKK